MEATARSGLEDRLAGGLLIGAAGIMMTGAAIGFLAPSLRDAPPFVSEDVEKVAAAIAGNPSAWAWANGLILAAAVLTALALVPISMRFRGRGHPWAVTGLVTFGFAAVFEAIDRIISIEVTTWAAQQYPDATAFVVWEAFDLVAGGLLNAFMILGFLALGLFGIAMAQTEVTSGRGWAFVFVGLLGILLELVGATIPAMVFLGTAAFGIATWRVTVPEPKTQHH